MFSLSLGVGELIVRGFAMYAFVFVLLRVVGKKHIGEMTPFDLVVLLLLSEAVQNALVSDEESLLGGMTVAATLFGASQLAGYLAWSNKRMERLLEGTPRVLVRNGRANNHVVAKEQITRSELVEALRRQGCASLSRVRFAVLENNGTITVGLKRDQRR